MSLGCHGISGGIEHRHQLAAALHHAFLVRTEGCGRAAEPVASWGPEYPARAGSSGFRHAERASYPSGQVQIDSNRHPSSCGRHEADDAAELITVSSSEHDIRYIYHED